ncbi:MAG: ABC transporter substrate-binding protein [Bacteroidales bacterium]
MKSTIKYIFLLPIFLSVQNCKNGDDKVENYNVSNEYAHFFNIEQKADNSIILKINENWNGENRLSSYKLIKRDDNAETKLDLNEISVPLKRVVCMSTSHISYINALGKGNTIVAISGGQYVSDTTISESVKKGDIVDIGFESSINYELLLSLAPDVLFTYGISGENNTYIDKIRALGIKVIVLGDYMEEHPLGKLEYLKLFGKLYGEDQLADSLYSRISGSYLSLRDSVARINYRPKVLVNAPWKDIWYIPGEKSYMNYLIKDAGGEILLCKEGRSNPHNVEEVFIEASKADIWLNPNFYTSLNDLSSSNPLFSKLAILSKGRVYNNTKRNTTRGGSDFWERGVIEPDSILIDLIKILHPGKGDGGDLKYYIKLE